MNNYTLTNPNATPEARRLFDYICENYGKKIISAVQECPGRWHEHEMRWLQNNVGRLPAMRGLDFIHDDYDRVVRRSKEWSRRGGIVTICWHTGVSGNTYPASKEELPDFERLMTPGTPEYKLLMWRWNKAANALLELQRANVPVLWRPFHEFDGQWFWWGKGGGEVFKELWRMMYRSFTEDCGLNNLIWVLGYSGEVKPDWYPGDEYCDIVGSDNYDGTTNLRAWERLKNITDKPLAFHECGEIRPIDDFVRDGNLWSWFMNWHTMYLEQNGAERLKEVYFDERVITLEDVKL